MAFRKKFHFIQVENPDILIVPECEHPDKLSGLNFHPTNVIWYGTNKNKGLAVFSFGGYKLNLLNTHETGIEIVCPISVTSDDFKFILLAVWAQQTSDWDYRHIGQVWKAIHYYEKSLLETPAIVIGDFNSSVIWDKNHRHASHSMTVNKLRELRMQSAYHTYFGVEQGSENHPTFYLYRHSHRPYHIDYCFLSEHFIKDLISVKVGDFNTWKIYSDHAPLTVQIDI